MKAYVALSWGPDTPHLAPEVCKAMLESVPAWQRAMRSTGIPSFGSGAIYPIPESEITYPPSFVIPDHWPRVYGMDVGWKVNAAVFLAVDTVTDTVYVYDEVYKGNAEPVVIAEAIKRRGGKWMPGVIDPAANGRAQKDGARLLEIYRDDNGLDLTKADNALVAGLTKVWVRLSEGRLKICTNCTKFLGEYRLYRRDEKGNIVKSPNHALDALRYAISSGLDRAVVEPKNIPGGRRWFDHRPEPTWFN